MLTEKQERYLTILKECVKNKEGDTIKGCSYFLKTLSKSEIEGLEMLYREITFSRRRYGNSVTYCWAHHSLFEDRNIDPWPATKYPKAVLMADMAIRI